MKDVEQIAKEIEDIIVDPTTLKDDDGYIAIAAPVSEWVIIIARLRNK